MVSGASMRASTIVLRLVPLVLIGQATLAASSADGQVWLVNVRCSLNSNGADEVPQPHFKFQHEDVAAPDFIDKRGITTIQWIRLKIGFDVSKPRFVTKMQN